MPILPEILVMLLEHEWAYEFKCSVELPPWDENVACLVSGLLIYDGHVLLEFDGVEQQEEEGEGSGGRCRC